MIRYATKPQQTLENLWAIHLHASDKAKECCSDESEDPVATGRRFSQSMCCNLSNPKEIAAPMACLYLNRGYVVYGSHTFIKLHIKSVLNAMLQRDQEVDVLLEADNSRSRFTPLSVRQNYTHRPVQLERLDLMTFLANWERCKGKRGIAFDQDHPIHGTHTLHEGPKRGVVVICHKHLPDICRDDLTDDERLCFQRSVMILFHSFRSPSDLSHHEGSFEEYFKRGGVTRRHRQLTCQDDASFAVTSSVHVNDDSVQVMDDLPSMNQVSVVFGLNTKQHKMFATASEKFLRTLLLGTDSTAQMIGFLGGLPGAGKSRVIAVLQCLALKWKAPEAVATAAYQDVAAQAANGQTIHKLFGWLVKSKKQWVPTQTQCERFAQVKMLILDEISTCDVRILAMVDKSLRQLLDRPSCVFGGVHVLLVGDWLEQLPVAGQPPYIHPSALLQPKKAKKKEVDDYLTRLRGLPGNQHMVTLTEIMRHRHDPDWKEILDKWRFGLYDFADLELVNRSANEANWTSPQTILKGYCPIIVTSNALLFEFNSVATHALCKETETPLHKFPGVVTRFPGVVTRARFPLSLAQQRSLRCTRDDKSNGMPAMLELAIGSTVQCTKNVSPALKLANGLIGTVVGFILANDDVVQVHEIDGLSQHSHSHPLEVVFVKLKDFATHSFSPHLPLGVISLLKRTERGIRIKMKKRSFSVIVTQVPLVPAYSLTTEKCQGLTVDKVVLALLRH